MRSPVGRPGSIQEPEPSLRRAGMRSAKCLTLLAGALVLCIPRAHAQYTTASLGGSVVDPDKAPLPRSEVTVRNVDTGFSQAATTDASGTFLFPRLPVGSY